METTFDPRVNSATPEGPPGTVIVPLDGSDYSARAVPIAAAFADRFGAELLLMTTPMTLEPTTEMPGWLETVARRGGAHVRTEVSECNEPVQAITELTKHVDHPAVCMATHSRGVLGAAALGSVTQGVVRKVGVPILLVGRHCSSDVRTDGPIVVCHDGSEAGDAVLSSARAWARSLDVEIVLLYVMHPLDIEGARWPGVAVAPAAEFLGSDTKVEVVRSSFPAGAIRDFAHEVDACLIAMSTHGRTGLARVVLGSVATWVTREGHCPVLVSRPVTLDAAHG